MFPASTKAGGMIMAPIDVCKTPAPPAPPVPVPYPDIGMLAQAQGTTLKITVGGAPAVTMMSVIPVTTGDEAGVAGGVISGQIKGMARPKKGSAKVIFQGAPVMYMTALWSLNGANPNVPAMAQTVPSQVKLTVAL